jgi:hypothetical protein
MTESAQPTAERQVWESLTQAQRDRLACIARQTLRIPTLETRNADRLDFHEVAVWTLREGLARALVAGKEGATGE